MKPRLLHHIDSIRSVTLRDCCRRILDTPEFLTWPASLSFHHAYTGGLLAHTVEVCDYALSAHATLVSSKKKDHTAALQWINIPTPDILIASALYHDFCKVREYEMKTFTAVEEAFERTKGVRMLVNPPNQPLEPVTAWVKRNSLLGDHAHIIQGTIEFTIAARESGVEESVIEQVQHCILAHHGRKEWGSPVEPQTIEALLLHQADLTSARFGVTKDAPL